MNKDKPITITQPPVKIKEPPIKIKADDIKTNEIEGEIIGETPIQTKHKNNRLLKKALSPPSAADKIKNQQVKKTIKDNGNQTKVLAHRLCFFFQPSV